MDQSFEKATYEAFYAAIKQFGPRVKGLSCFMNNWRVPKPQPLKKAA